MEGHTTRVGSVEIELRNIGTVHLKLPVSDVKQLMEFIKGISTSQRPGLRPGEPPIGLVQLELEKISPMGLGKVYPVI